MPRNLTDPNYDDTFEWQERVTDSDGDSLSISVTIDGTDISNVAWADFTTTTNTINGDETEVLVDFTADRSGMTEGETYQFEVTADDGLATTTRTFQLEVTQPPPPYNGKNYISSDITNSSIEQYNPNTAFRLTGNSPTKAINFSNKSGFNVTSPTGTYMKEDGTQLWVSFTWPKVVKVNLSTPFDVSTGSKGGEITNSVIPENDPQDLYLSPDGKKLYTCHANTDRRLYEYDLGTAYDPSTVSYNSNFFDPDPEPPIYGITFRRDGLKAIGCTSNESSIFEYDLTSAFDITTMSQVNKNSNLPAPISAVHVTPGSETDLFAVDTNENKYRFTFDNGPWDISSITQQNFVSSSVDSIFFISNP